LIPFTNFVVLYPYSETLAGAVDGRLGFKNLYPASGIGQDVRHGSETSRDLVRTLLAGTPAAEVRKPAKRKQT
jgi:hypothetical protein